MKNKFKFLFLLFYLLFFILAFIPEANAATLNSEPKGKGSLPSRFFPDGTICLVNEETPSACLKKLVTLPNIVRKADAATFYGVFDIDADGIPEVFVDYWYAFNKKQENNSVTLLVYKKINEKYKKFLKLEAETYGYSTGAWFLKETPFSKAIFMTRYGGSSGAGLFYLDMKNKSLNLISDLIYLEGYPEFIDLDSDGVSEIFLPGRGRDRTANPGAAILHWKDNGYRTCWPDWNGLPSVIYAALTDIEKDGKKEVTAILEPQEINYDQFVDGETSVLRELGVWQISEGKPVLISKTKVPDSKYMSEPNFGRLPPISSNIELIYSKTIGCSKHGDKMQCAEER